MATDYLLLETGDKLILEDASGNLILESSTSGAVTVPVWLFDDIGLGQGAA